MLQANRSGPWAISPQCPIILLYQGRLPLISSCWPHCGQEEGEMGTLSICQHNICSSPFIYPFHPLSFLLLSSPFSFTSPLLSSSLPSSLLPFLSLSLSPLLSPGFTALDATVLAMTEIMWTFVHVNHKLIDPVLKYTIRFLLAPVCQHSIDIAVLLN